jgi:glycosyltransferase involved in cell wall biosynthesis
MHPDLEIAMRKWILANFDLVVGIARNTRNDLESTFGPLKTPYVEGLHGHYEGLYPITESRERSVRRFGLDSGKFRILMVLSDKPYKGQIPFLEAWAQAETQGLQLVLAGAASPGMKNVVDSLPGDVIHLNVETRIPHYALGDLHWACDMVALPYLRITTSGAYFLALTLKRPVFAPDLPFFKLHAGHSRGVAFLYDHLGGVGKICEALTTLNRDRFESDPLEFQALMEQFSWRKFAETVAPALEGLLKAH